MSRSIGTTGELVLVKVKEAHFSLPSFGCDVVESICTSLDGFCVTCN